MRKEEKMSKTILYSTLGLDLDIGIFISGIFNFLYEEEIKKKKNLSWSAFVRNFCF